MAAGRVRHLGLSNFPLTQVEEVLSWAAVKPVVNQVESQPLLAQRKLVGVCLRKVGALTMSRAGAGRGCGLECVLRSPARQSMCLPASLRRVSPPLALLLCHPSPCTAGRAHRGLQPAGPQRPRAAHSPCGGGGGGGGGQDARAGARTRGAAGRGCAGQGTAAC